MKPIDKHLNTGTGKMMDGDYDGAITAFGEAIRLDPVNADAHFGMGHAYWCKADAFFQRGQAYSTKCRYHTLAAIDALTEAVRLEPRHWGASKYLQEAKTLLQKLDLPGLPPPPPISTPGGPSRRSVIEAMTGSGGGHQTSQPYSQPASQQSANKSVRWWDCPWCGKSYRDEDYNPNETVACQECGCQFQTAQAINLRTTPQPVEEHGFLRRMVSGSSIQKPRRQHLIDRISMLRNTIRLLSIGSSVQDLQRAQLLQAEMYELNRELEEHGG